MWSFKRNIYKVSNPVIPVNCPIAAADDYRTYTLGPTYTIDVVANDGPIDDPVINIVTAPLHGTAAIVIPGAPGDIYPYITYTSSDAGFYSDSLVYEVTGRTCTNMPYPQATLYLSRSGDPTPPAYIPLSISNPSGLSNCSCSPNPCITTFPITIYVESWPITLGSGIFLNSGLTIPYTGNSGYQWNCLSTTLCLQISPLGIVTAISDCRPEV